MANIICHVFVQGGEELNIPLALSSDSMNVFQSEAELAIPLTPSSDSADETREAHIKYK